MALVDQLDDSRQQGLEPIQESSTPDISYTDPYHVRRLVGLAESKSKIPSLATITAWLSIAYRQSAESGDSLTPVSPKC
jgi:hypothetical protein